MGRPGNPGYDRQGTTVEIFESPITEERPEGAAVLVRPVDLNCGYFDGRVLERWFVRFVKAPAGEDGEYERAILAPRID